MVGILGLYGLLVHLFNKEKILLLHEIIVTFIKCLFLIFVPGFSCEDSALTAEYLLELEGILGLEFRKKRLNFKRNDGY